MRHSCMTFVCAFKCLANAFWAILRLYLGCCLVYFFNCFYLWVVKYMLCFFAPYWFVDFSFQCIKANNPPHWSVWLLRIPGIYNKSYDIRKRYPLNHKSSSFCLVSNVCRTSQIVRHFSFYVFVSYLPSKINVTL